MLRLFALAALVALALPATAQDSVLIENVATFSGGMRGGSGPYTLLSLRDGAIIVAGDATSRADSASTAWDLGLRGNEVILNGGTSGPGGLRGAIVDVAFEDLVAVPDAPLAADGETECPRGEDRVVCHGSGNGWYLYADNGVQPIPTRTLVVARPDGEMLKVRFVEYTLGRDLGGVIPRFVTLEVAPLGDGSEG